MNKSLTMINSKISSTFVTRSFRRNVYYTLNLQRNFSKISTAAQIHTFRYNVKNQSSHFPLSSGFSRRSLLIPASSNVESQRNFSNILRDIQKYFEPETEDAAAKPTTNALESEETSLSLSEILDNVSNSWLIKNLENYIADVHEVSGLPWWATIAFTTFLFRTSVVLPFAAGQLILNNSLRRVEIQVKKSIPAITTIIAQDKKKFGWTDEIAKKKFDIAVERKRNGLIYNNNCHPMKNYILPLVQIPFWLSMTLATRNLCIPNPSDVSNQVYTELSTEGFAWITNLTDVDHYMVLPISLALVNLAIIEFHQLFRVEPRTKPEQRKAMFLRTISLGFIPVAAYMPAALNIYWLSSSLYGFIQIFILNSKATRYIFKLPVPEPELKHPYRLLKKNVQLRLGMKTSKAVNNYVMSVPGDCKKYQVCDYSGCFVFNCGIGTEFNPRIKVCDFPLRDRSYCGDRGYLGPITIQDNQGAYPGGTPGNPYPSPGGTYPGYPSSGGAYPGYPNTGGAYPGYPNAGGSYPGYPAAGAAYPASPSGTYPASASGAYPGGQGLPVTSYPQGTGTA